MFSVGYERDRSIRFALDPGLRQLRRDLAVRYLDDRKLHVSKIAWLLGFHEVSAFTHALKRWTGKRPIRIPARCAGFGPV
jgi:transcriptional regulator GlxA family with amidase domain